MLNIFNASDGSFAFLNVILYLNLKFPILFKLSFSKYGDNKKNIIHNTMKLHLVPRTSLENKYILRKTAGSINFCSHFIIIVIWR